MQFRVKKDTKMQKIFDSYGQRKGIPPESIRFLLEDKRIRGDSTPKMLELEDGDQIDAMYVSTYQVHKYDSYFSKENLFINVIRLDQVGGGEADGEEDGKAGAITVRVRDQVGEEMMFKVKKDTKMLKIFEAYSKRRGVSTDSLRFTLDGERIEADSTPKLLELEDNDQIDVLLRQEVCNPITNATYIRYIHSYKGGGADEEAKSITISVRGSDGKKQPFKVKMETPFAKVFRAYSEKVGVDPKSVHFLYDGRRLTDTETPKMVEMQDEDQIDVVVNQTGGTL